MFSSYNQFCLFQYVGFFPLDGVTNIELKGKNNEWHMIKKSRKIVLKVGKQAVLLNVNV
jgi:hypothetical protein